MPLRGKSNVANDARSVSPNGASVGGGVGVVPDGLQAPIMMQRRAMEVPSSGSASAAKLMLVPKLNIAVRMTISSERVAFMVMRIPGKSVVGFVVCNAFQRVCKASKPILRRPVPYRQLYAPYVHPYCIRMSMRVV